MFILNLVEQEVSFPQKQLTFKDQQSDMLNCIHEMMEENRKMRQNLQRLSDIVAYSPVLASEASVSSFRLQSQASGFRLQQPLEERAGVSSTPKSTCMQASLEDDWNPSRAEHTPLLQPSYESLLLPLKR